METSSAAGGAGGAPGAVFFNETGVWDIEKAIVEAL
jgi:hypothetical protein